MGKVKELMMELKKNNPDDDDYEYLYNEWLKQFEPKITLKKLKTIEHDKEKPIKTNQSK